ncbi:7527_t:CDS:2, partial [Racocetra fulgida]
TKEHNPIFVGTFIDLELNDVIVTLYHEFDQQNAEYIEEVRRLHVRFEYQHLPNPQNLLNEHSNLRIMKRQPPPDDSDDDDIPMMVTPIIAGDGRCFRPDLNYYLLPWNSEVVRNNIGKMTGMGRLEREIDFAILKIPNNLDFRLHREPLNLNPLPSTANDNKDIGGPVFSYHMNIIDGDLRTSRSGLSSILTGGIGHFAFMTQLDKIRDEAKIYVVSSTGIH